MGSTKRAPSSQLLLTLVFFLYHSLCLVQSSTPAATAESTQVFSLNSDEESHGIPLWTRYHTPFPANLAGSRLCVSVLRNQCVTARRLINWARAKGPILECVTFCVSARRCKASDSRERQQYPVFISLDQSIRLPSQA